MRWSNADSGSVRHYFERNYGDHGVGQFDVYKGEDKQVQDE